MWSNDPESYAGVSVAAGRAFHVRQAKRDTLVLQGAGLGAGLTIPRHKKRSVEKLLKLETGRQFWKRVRSTKDYNARRRRRRRRRSVH